MAGHGDEKLDADLDEPLARVPLTCLKPHDSPGASKYSAPSAADCLHDCHLLAGMCLLFLDYALYIVKLRQDDKE